MFLLTFAIILLGAGGISHGVPLGRPCNSSEQCDGYPETTICEDILGLCFCNWDHITVENPEGLTCEPIRMKIGETCKVKQQCTEGVPGELSDCLASNNNSTQTVCNCTEKAVHEAGEHVCYLKRNLIGDNCDVNAQCTANMGDLSLCDDLTHKCACSTEAVGNNNGTFCLQIVNLLGEKCEESLQCTLGTPGMYSDCVESIENPSIKVCSCINGANPNPEQNQCLKSSGLIGQPCQEDKDCVGFPGISSACSKSGICSCLGGYLPSSHMGNCLAIINGLGKGCMESAQCQKGISGILSACIFESCRCTAYSINAPGENVCLRRAALVGDPCQVHEQCWGNLGEKSYCIGEKCECTRDGQPSFDLSKCV